MTRAKSLPNAERLGQIIIRSDFEAEDFVMILGLGRQHQDRRVQLLPNLFANFISAKVGQHQIQDNAIRDLAAYCMETFSAGFCGRHLIALELENILESAGHFLFIFDNQHSLHRLNSRFGIRDSRFRISNLES